jgi:hypothetical protein
MEALPIVNLAIVAKLIGVLRRVNYGVALGSLSGMTIEA